MSEFSTERASPEEPSLNGLLTTEQLPERFPVRFHSVASVRWLVRNERAQLTEHGALLVLGNRDMFEPTALERYLLEQGRVAARARAQRVDA